MTIHEPDTTYFLLFVATITNPGTKACFINELSSIFNN